MYISTLKCFWNREEWDQEIWPWMQGRVSEVVNNQLALKFTNSSSKLRTKHYTRCEHKNSTLSFWVAPIAFNIGWQHRITSLLRRVLGFHCTMSSYSLIKLRVCSLFSPYHLIQCLDWIKQKWTESNGIFSSRLDKSKGEDNTVVKMSAILHCRHEKVSSIGNLCDWSQGRMILILLMSLLISVLM